MTNIVDSMRKHQKMIVLGAALAVITLYIIPVDQLVSAVNPGIQRALERIADIRARLDDDLRIGDNTFARLDSQLQSVEYRLLEIDARL